MWNILFHCVSACYCDWFNKEADWPIDRQAKVRWEDIGKEGKSEGCQLDGEEASWKGHEVKEPWDSTEMNRNGLI